MKKILLDKDLKEKIAKELSTTTQTVRMSLIYANNSDKAKLIRKKAIELLRKEADEAEAFEKQLENQ